MHVIGHSCSQGPCLSLSLCFMTSLFWKHTGQVCSRMFLDRVEMGKYNYINSLYPNSSEGKLSLLAEREAEALKSSGNETHVYPKPSNSTLGKVRHASAASFMMAKSRKTQISIHRRMDGLVCSCSATLLSHKADEHEHFSQACR